MSRPTAADGTTRLANRAYYDEFSHRYEAERGHGYHALIDDLEVDLALRYVRGARVLEAGCGTGLISERLAPHAGSLVGLDLSSGMLRHAARRGLTVVQGSVTDLPFPDESFDVVCSFKVLAHVTRIEQALRELSRVTRPGGHLILEFYNPLSLRYLVKRLKRPTAISEGTTDEAVFTRYDTLDAVRRALPPAHRVVDLRGVRVVTPVSTVFKVATVGRLFRYLEWKACDAPVLRRLGGFLIVVAEKPR
ncbi:MAG: class I SAM-dependent methyltransferase [Myxococcales bacterium]|nr:class I SAM-dependent methyltransferase [Myxococcales bacterium]